MMFLKFCAVTLLAAICVYYVNENLYTKHPLYVDNSLVDVRFKGVYEAFRQNFVDDWENAGAALVVYHKGKKVMDAWGGYADKQAARKWQKDTLTVTFSTTKAVAALCVALLVDRKMLSYDDLVTKYWPEFGKNGKGNITVQMVMSHTAGLPFIEEEISLEAASDHLIMRKILEREKPKWAPGTTSGYHVYSYGWLVDQIIRHSDSKHRGIGQFFREEIANRFGIDYFIGLPSDQQYRVARMSRLSLKHRVGEVLADSNLLERLWWFLTLKKDSFFLKALNNPKWLRATYDLTMNNPDYHRLEQAAALGIGNARSLAQLFTKLRTTELLSSKMLKHLKLPHVNGTDAVIGKQMVKGNGMLYFKINSPMESVAFGHTGHGCQQVSYDPKNDLVIAYVTNDLKMGLYMECRTYARLHKAIYDVLMKSL